MSAAESLGEAAPAGPSQLVYLSFGGASGVAYDGPVRVEGIEVAPFSASGVGLTGAESTLIAQTLDVLNITFEPLGVRFTAERPTWGTEYSTVYVGGTDAAFSSYGSFHGLAESVDVGNLDRTDSAFVFSEEITGRFPGALAYSRALAEVIGHEVGHLIGIGHGEPHDEPRGPLAEVAYGQSPDSPVHQFLTREGYRFFEDQFGPSVFEEVATGSVPGSFPATTLIDVMVGGAFQEDQPGSNPFGQGDTFGGMYVNHPSTRHFWDHRAFIEPSGFYSRAFEDGINDEDSAANRAIKYLTGGFGLNGILDPEWGDGQGALVDVGTFAAYDRDDLDRAFDYIGHAAHLLQDLTVPAHSHADPHVDLAGLTAGVVGRLDPDPYHDWIDGLPFGTTTAITGNPLRLSNFTDINPTRWRSYGLSPDLKAAGMESETIRSAREIWGGFTTGTPDLTPAAMLLLETARIAEAFDTKDYIGLLTQLGATAPLGPISAPADGTGIEYSPGLDYAAIGLAALDAQSRVLVPKAIISTAELIRYFLGTVDPYDPTVEMVGFSSADEARPQAHSDPIIRLTAAATDQREGSLAGGPRTDSGVGKDKFRYEYREKAPGGDWTDWMPLDLDDRNLVLSQRPAHFDKGGGDQFGPTFTGKHGASNAPEFKGKEGYSYGFRATAEDGAGNVSDPSDPIYVRVGPAGVEVVEVVDRSGSMGDAGKLEAAQQAASVFVELLDQGDSIGIASFSDGASANYALTSIPPDSEVVPPNSTIRQQAQFAIEQLISDGSTSIGAGVQTAGAMLGGADPQSVRAMIVLTDGMQNTPPDPIEVINSQIASDVRVFTIGFGSDTDPNLLRQMASIRNGEFYFAAGNSALNDIYARLSGAVADEQDIMRQQGVIAPGQQQSRSFLVDPSASQITAGLLWPGSDLDLALIRPDGSMVTRSTNDPGIRFIRGETFEFFKIDAPMAGTWRMIVQAIDVDPTGEPFEVFAREDTPLKARFLGDSAYEVGDTVQLLVRLTDGDAIRGATVVARVSPPASAGGTALESVLFDDGLHGDGAAGDGVYGTSFLAGLAGAGAYQVQIEATGTANGGFGFVRAPSRTLLVTGEGRADATPPTIVGLQRLGFHADPTRIVLAFSEPIDPARAGDPSLYALFSPGRDRRLNTADDAPVAITNAAYDAATGTVTLRLKRPLPLRVPHLIVARGDGAGAIGDAVGNSLDGDGDGVAGGDYTQVLHQFGPGPGSLRFALEEARESRRDAISKRAEARVARQATRSTPTSPRRLVNTPVEALKASAAPRLTRADLPNGPSRAFLAIGQGLAGRA